MKSRLRIPLIVLAAIIIAAASIAYGAATAPRHQTQVEQKKATPTPTPPPAVKKTLNEKLLDEKSSINGVLVAAYPKVTTDYTIINEQLFDQGQWYGAVLTYHGTDTNNRDSLRVLMQKKDGVWIIRTKPPVIILSSKQFPDVPKTILQAINKPVAIP